MTMYEILSLTSTSKAVLNYWSTGTCLRDGAGFPASFVSSLMSDQTGVDVVEGLRGNLGGLHIAIQVLSCLAIHLLPRWALCVVMPLLLLLQSTPALASLYPKDCAETSGQYLLARCPASLLRHQQPQLIQLVPSGPEGTMIVPHEFVFPLASTYDVSVPCTTGVFVVLPDASLAMLTYDECATPTVPGEWTPGLERPPPALDSAVAPNSAAGLEARAHQVHEVLDAVAAKQRTTAVLRTSGKDIVAGGARDLTPAQRLVLNQGETAAKLPGAHAEVTALKAAEAAGLHPKAIGVTRRICPECQQAIEASGGRLTSPTTADWE